MKKKAARAVALILIASCWAMFGAACKKQAVTTSEPTSTYEQLPEAANVLSALNEKNYEEAVAAFVKVKQSVSTEEQQNQLALLSRELKDKLRDASATDPKAAEALQALRAVTLGR